MAQRLQVLPMIWDAQAESDRVESANEKHNYEVKDDEL